MRDGGTRTKQRRRKRSLAQHSPPPGTSGFRDCVLFLWDAGNISNIRQQEWVSAGNGWFSRRLARGPGEGNGNPLRYSCLENPVDGGTWQAAIHGIHWESDTTEQLHFSFSLSCIGEGNGNPFRYSCLENPRDGGAWWAAVHGVARSWTQLSDFTFTFHFHALEKEMATHSSVLAWRIPGTGEPGELPSMGSHRVGHDWSDLAAAAAAP